MSPSLSALRPTSPALRGALVPADETYTVVGMYQGIVNLSAHDSAGDYLISLISDPVHWTELALLMGPDDPWWAHPRSAGDRVVLGDLESRPAPPPRTGIDAPEISAAVVREAREALLRDFPETGFVGLLASEPPRSDPFVQRAAGLLRKAPDGTVSSISTLIGLGIGFTPAGDDFVSGALLGEMLISRMPPTEMDRAAILARVHATTAGGSSLLRVAAAGYPPAYQLAMVEALVGNQVATAIDIAQRHGHSSGLDALSGLLWAI